MPPASRMELRIVVSVVNAYRILDVLNYNNKNECPT